MLEDLRAIIQLVKADDGFTIRDCLRLAEYAKLISTSELYSFEYFWRLLTITERKQFLATFHVRLDPS